MFFSLSNNVLPYNRVCEQEDLVNSSNLQSILLKVLRSSNRSSLNVGQWRRKCEVLRYRHMFKTFIIIIIENITWKILTNFRYCFWRPKKKFEFWMVGSKLFHSMIVEEIREPLKKMCLILKEKMLSMFLLAYAWVFSGICLKSYWVLLFLQIL